MCSAFRRPVQCCVPTLPPLMAAVQSAATVCTRARYRDMAACSRLSVTLVSSVNVG